MILVVDDDDEILAAVRRTLRPLNLPVTLMADPNEALEALTTGDFGVVLSDVDMPLMNGHELLRRARGLRPDIVRLLMTGRGTLDSAVRAINEGEVHRFICKPFETAELRSMVSEAVSRRDELGKRTEAGVRLERQRQVIAQLESEVPGISRFERTASGAYRLDGQRASAGERVLAHLGVIIQPAS